MHHFVKPLMTAATMTLLLSVAPAMAETVNLMAELTAASEVPPAASTGSGKLEATFDTETKVLTWTVTYEGLSGPATAAHFHGPAAEGENAPPALPIEGELASPITGTATLDEQQATDVQGGRWYFNVHTEKFPDGEIRGQVVKAAM